MTAVQPSVTVNRKLRLEAGPLTSTHGCSTRSCKQQQQQQQYMQCNTGSANNRSFCCTLLCAPAAGGRCECNHSSDSSKLGLTVVAGALCCSLLLHSHELRHQQLPAASGAQTLNSTSLTYLCLPLLPESISANCLSCAALCSRFSCSFMLQVH
jgi:hypothetical protein